MSTVFEGENEGEGLSKGGEHEREKRGVISVVKVTLFTC